MYRLRLQFDAWPDGYQHQNTDCDIATFVDIATGLRLLAIMSDDERALRDIDSGEAWYTAVWNPEINDWVNNLTREQAEAAYQDWSRPDYP